MRLITIAELPEQVFFWRKGNSLGWIKMHRRTISPLGKVAADRAFVEADPLEIVLSDPNWCCDCWSEFPHWPPLGPCPHCGSTSSPVTLEESRMRIAEWTGCQNPHI